MHTQTHSGIHAYTYTNMQYAHPHTTDPFKASEKFSSAQLMPNLALKRYIDEFLEVHTSEKKLAYTRTHTFAKHAERERERRTFSTIFYTPPPPHTHT